jgi:hypothetical protein
MSLAVYRVRSLAVVRRVLRLEGRPLFRQVVFEEDRLHRAHFGANAAVDALGRIDEVLLLVVFRMDAVDRADLDARASLVPIQGWAMTYAMRSAPLPSGGWAW